MAEAGTRVSIEKPVARDRISEILDRRSRQHRRGERWERFSRRMLPIMKASLELPKTRELTTTAKAELLRYFPIGVVAALEGYFRMLYADLINSGDPYATRAQAFRDIKIAPSAASAVDGRKVSIGEFISHQLRHNSFRDIRSNMSVLLDQFESILSSESVAPWATFAWGKN